MSEQNLASAPECRICRRHGSRRLRIYFGRSNNCWRGDLPRDTYLDVALSLYHENGTRITTEELGDLDPSEGLPVDLQTEVVPEYVIFTSPDFWSEDTSIEYMEKDPEGHNGYAVREISRPEQLPVGSDFSGCEGDE